MVKTNGKVITNGGIGNEVWYKSRRIQAAIFSIIVAALAAAVNTGLIPADIYSIFVPLISIVAGYLGIVSWIKPK